MQARNDLIEHLKHTFKAYGLNIREYVQASFPSVYVSTTNKRKTKVLLQAHLDVVPARDEQFDMSEDDEKLYGRGVFDMKFAAACYLQLIEDLKDELDKYDFGIMLTTDEEQGGENGVGALLEHGYTADVCILPDGGDNWQIEESCNSVWIVKIRSLGNSAHGSRPWEGDNAITKLTDCIYEIRKQFTNKKYENTLTVSQINGGCALNQVPDQAWATLDMRFKNEANYIELRPAIEKSIVKEGLLLETIAHVGATKLNTNNQFVKSFIDIAQTKAPVELGYCHSLGSSDAHYFESRGIPTILVRPRGGGAHSDTEWVNKADLDTYYELIKEYVTQNARIA